MNAASPHIPPHPATATPLPADLADMRRIDMREVRVLVGLSESRIRELIAAGRFPQPSYRDGPRCTRWSVGSIRQWLQDSQAAAK